jgi:hypothetical protein
VGAGGRGWAARAALAAIAFGAGYPSRVQDLGAGPTDRDAEATLARCSELPHKLLEWTDAQLGTRMPALGDGERGQLACTILAEAEGSRVDPLLVLALIEVESSFDPDAASEMGALGLMQLTPETMRHMAERSHLAGVDPSDPRLNVQAGIRYLRRLLDAFGGEDVALMAYNAGPNRILAYLREEGGISDRFRDYPRRVSAERRRLRRSRGEEPATAVAERAIRGATAVE